MYKKIYLNDKYYLKYKYLFNYNNNNFNIINQNLLFNFILSNNNNNNLLCKLKFKYSFYEQSYINIVLKNNYIFMPALDYKYYIIKNYNKININFLVITK